MHTCHHITIPFVKVNPRIIFFLIFFQICVSYLLPSGGILGYPLLQSEYMEGDYYILQQAGGVPQGPFSRAALSEMAARGEVLADTPVLYSGAWCTYAQLPAPPPCPPSYMAWSIISVFCCFPFSLVAVSQSSRVLPLHEQGQYDAALAASRSALRWNLFFSITVVLMLLFCWVSFSYAYRVWQESDNELLRILTGSLQV